MVAARLSAEMLYTKAAVKPTGSGLSSFGQADRRRVATFCAGLGHGTDGRLRCGITWRTDRQIDQPPIKLLTLAASTCSAGHRDTAAEHTQYSLITFGFYDKFAHTSSRERIEASSILHTFVGSLLAHDLAGTVQLGDDVATIKRYDAHRPWSFMIASRSAMASNNSSERLRR